MIQIPKINVQLFVSDLSEDTPAVSEPIRVLGDDFQDYVLKTQEIFDEQSKTYHTYDASFINETLAYCIGKHIGLPQPEIAIANLDKAFLDAEPKLKFYNRFSEGEHFATTFIDGSVKNLVKDYQLAIESGKKHLQQPWPRFFRNLNNSEDVSLIILFDLLIANVDRFAHPDNFLLIKKGSESTIYAIDHGHAFGGPIWNTNSQEYLYNQTHLAPTEYVKWFVNGFVLYNQRQIQSGIFKLNGLGDIFKALNHYVDLTELDNHSFLEPLRRIQSITSKEINIWLNQIPEEWFVDRNLQINFYTQYLLNQIRLLPSIIQYLANTGGFENYQGGTLTWDTTQNHGIQ